ncbi:hypothetical protein CDD83_2067 [Cordyceps sp. RAO-2017]|nr:hypothetical protein CDD83_2067 [Cordyceps sp. RAO-2017]
MAARLPAKRVLVLAARLPAKRVPVPAKGEECAKVCSDKYNECRGKPEANRSTCASAYSDCLGFSPFGPDGSLVTPTACAPGKEGGKGYPGAGGEQPVVVTAGAEGSSRPVMALLALAALALL